MGEFLKQMPKHEGGRPPKTSTGKEEVSTIPQIGITHKQAATAQKLASIPEPEFKERVAGILFSRLDGPYRRIPELLEHLRPPIQPA